MHSKEERKLENYSKGFEQMTIPEDALDKAIEAGLQKAKSERKRKPRKKWFLSAALVALLLMGFFTSIRVSPVFAQYVSTIPGMEKIVELIRHDKGMMTAIENDYYQEIGVSAQKNGIELVIDGAIADENGLVLFYTLNADEKQKSMTTDHPELKALDGGEMEIGSISYGTPHHSEEGEYSYSGTIDYFFQKPLTAREFQFDLEVKGDSIQEEFSLKFHLPKEIYGKKTYEINETVTIEGQKIHLLEATVYPLRVAVHVKMDSDNTKRLLEFQDIRLVDEKGEAWSKINNGTTASNLSDNETIYYLQSNYFNEPEELYVAFNKIQAIDKNNDVVVVDVEKNEIIKQPEGNKLRDMKIIGQDIYFNLYTKEEFPYFMFSKVTDSDGKEIEKTSGFSESFREEDGFTRVGITVPKIKSHTNPLTLELSFYPQWIEGEGKIRIK